MEKPVKHPGKRRHARELAVQFLYQFDLSTGDTLADALPMFWQTQTNIEDNVRTFAEELIHGCATNRESIDEKLRKYTEHWELPRMAAVDRNILRLAIYEMTCRDDIPPVVSINEAVEIAKRYSTRESGAFVNGILDRLRSDLPRPARTASGK
ncbi:MAG: transcription antitermination factor NusB [Verrucomicrobia bacterium]|nr:transcription antitermination factor NusB [Verrucomicrobiota bacterium]